MKVCKLTPAIPRHPSDDGIVATLEPALLARRTGPVVATVPSGPYTVAHLPLVIEGGAHGHDSSDYLVAGDDGESGAVAVGLGVYV